MTIYIMSNSTFQESISNMSATTTIMTFLDDNKDGMNEGLYLKFCNLLKKENEEEKEVEKFYKVKYLYTKCDPLNDNCFYKMRILVSTQIIKIDTKTYKEIQEYIEKDGYTRRGTDNLAFDGDFNDHNVCYTESCDEDECSCGNPIRSTIIHLQSDARIIKITEA